MKKRIFNKIEVLVGKDSKLAIGYDYKVGNGSLNDIENNYPKNFSVRDLNLMDKGYTFVIIIRNPYERWISGLKQELTGFNQSTINTWRQFQINNWFDNEEEVLLDVVKKQDAQRKVETYDEFHVFTRPGHTGTKLSFELIERVFTKLRNGLLRGHATVGRWSSANLTLFELLNFENVYFLDLKDLSNPNFLNWLKERDKNWLDVDRILHLNDSKDDKPKIFIEQFFRNALIDKKLRNKIFNPYYREKVYKTKNAEFNVFEQVLENVFQYEEQIIEHIKKSSKFLNFDEVYELGTPEYLERYLNDKSHTS